MNCDTAFELITDSTGSRSEALAQHLDHCPRCRQMQETLAPALGFLAPAGWNAAAPEPDDEREAAATRQPFVTLEALAVARDVARALAARTEPRHGRLKSVTSRILPYAAICAGGILLGLVLVEQWERPSSSGAPPEKACTRHEAARDDTSRSGAEIRRLAVSCAACHDASKPLDHRATLLEWDTPGQPVWFNEFFREETLMAADCHHRKGISLAVAPKRDYSSA